MADVRTDGRIERGDRTRPLVPAHCRHRLGGRAGWTVAGRLASESGLSKNGVFALFGSEEDLQLATVRAAGGILLDHVVDRGRAPAGHGPGVAPLRGPARVRVVHPARGVVGGRDAAQDPRVAVVVDDGAPERELRAGVPGCRGAGVPGCRVRVGARSRCVCAGHASERRQLFPDESRLSLAWRPRFVGRASQSVAKGPGSPCAAHRFRAPDRGAARWSRWAPRGWAHGARTAPASGAPSGSTRTRCGRRG